MAKATKTHKPPFRRSQWSKNTSLIAEVLRREGKVRRSQLLPPHFDKHTDFVDVYNLGPILGPQLRRMLDDYGPFEWEASFPDVTFDQPYKIVKLGGKDVAVVDSGEVPIGE